MRVSPVILFVAAACLAALPVAAQDPAPVHQHGTPSPSAEGWTWSADANVFAGFNYQRRRFADFASWESQNWLMASAMRKAPGGRVIATGMLSLEPLTLGKYVYVVGGERIEPGGSPQLFQTGESFRHTPLVNYQHPHDLVMGLGATYRIERPRRGHT